MESNKAKTIDEYIVNCPKEVQTKIKRHAHNHQSVRTECDGEN